VIFFLEVIWHHPKIFNRFILRIYYSMVIRQIINTGLSPLQSYGTYLRKNSVLNIIVMFPKSQLRAVIFCSSKNSCKLQAEVVVICVKNNHNVDRYWLFFCWLKNSLKKGISVLFEYATIYRILFSSSLESDLICRRIPLFC